MLRLSHHTVRGAFCLIFNSIRKDEIHINSEVAFAKLLYLASVVDLETVCCFLDHQDTMLLLRKIQKLVVDLRSSISFP